MLKPLHLKELNDRYGHDAGDAAMSAIANALRIYVRDRKGGTAYRLRSNETALLLNRYRPRRSGIMPAFHPRLP